MTLNCSTIDSPNLLAAKRPSASGCARVLPLIHLSLTRLDSRDCPFVATSKVQGYTRHGFTFSEILLLLEDEVSRSQSAAVLIKTP